MRPTGPLRALYLSPHWAAGQYGANGTLYATETQSNSLIWSFSDPSTGITDGPAYWVVRLPAGITMWLGSTPDSRFMPAGRTDIAHSWSLSRQSDVNGNYFTATYVALPAYGTSVLSYVNYTGNDAAGA
jgi:hypothetical protein